VSILFTRKMRSKKKGAFCKVCPFFKWRVWKWRGLKNKNLSYLKMWKSCLFLKPEMSTPPSYFTGNAMQLIYIDWYAYSFHVKFKIRFAISFMREFMSTKKWHFSWGDGPSFFFFFLEKAMFKKIGNFLVFLIWRMLIK
jgi:hypothetical protein